MPFAWPWSPRPADTQQPTSTHAERDVCKDASCAIQTCLKKNDFQADACAAAVESLRQCCRQAGARASVHCAKAWKAK